MPLAALHFYPARVLAACGVCGIKVAQRAADFSKISRPKLLVATESLHVIIMKSRGGFDPIRMCVWLEPVLDLVKL